MQEQNRRFASAIQQFGKDARSYVEDGAIGTPPTAKLTGDPNVDVVLRCLNDLVKTVWPIFAEMNKELGALETPDDAFKGAFTPEQLRSGQSLPSGAETRQRRLIILFKVRRPAMPQQGKGRKSMTRTSPRGRRPD